MKLSNNIKVLDLFAGAGGFSLGFEMAGCQIQACLEIDEWAIDTLKHNHKSAHIIHKDIRNINSRSKILDEIKEIPDVIIGGPPCQGFSIAGPTKDPNDPRNSLFIEFARWVKALSPKIFVMENVNGLLSRKNSEGEKVINIISSNFNSLGYNTQIWKLNAAEYGVPQIRNRIFIVGSKNGLDVKKPLKTHTLNYEKENLQPAITVQKAIGDLPEIEASQGVHEMNYSFEPNNEYQEWARVGSLKVHNHIAMKHTKRVVKRYKEIQNGTKVEDLENDLQVKKRNGSGSLSKIRYNSNYRHLKPDMISYTIPASFYSNFIHPTTPRNITAREAARIQSFPDNYVFKGKRTQISSKLLKRLGKENEDFLSQYNQIGNAVPPLLAKKIAESIKETLSRNT